MNLRYILCVLTKVLKVEQIAELRKQGIKVIIVTSGAVAAGRHILGITNTTAEVPFRQVLAAAGQGRLMQAYEQLFPVRTKTLNEQKKY